MDFKISKPDLVKLLARVAPATSAKSPMAILSSIMLRAESNGTLTAIGSDLIMSATATTQAHVRRSGSLAVTARQIVDVAKNLPSGDVAIALSKDGSRLEVKAGKSKFRLPVGDPDDFPATPDAKNAKRSLTMASPDFGRMLAQSAYARHIGDGRDHIACVRIEHEGGHALAVATDGKRMAVSRAPATSSDWAPVQIGARVLGELGKLAAEFGEDDVRLAVSGAYVFACWPSVTVSCKLVEGDFVPWRKFQLAAPKTRAQLARQELADAVRRVALVGDDKIGTVAITASDGFLLIESESAAKGTASEQVDAAITGDGGKIHVMAAQVVEACNALLDDAVELSMGGDRDPVMLRGVASPDDCYALTLPIVVGV